MHFSGCDHNDHVVASCRNPYDANVTMSELQLWFDSSDTKNHEEFIKNPNIRLLTECRSCGKPIAPFRLEKSNI